MYSTKTALSETSDHLSMYPTYANGVLFRSQRVVDEVVESTDTVRRDLLVAFLEFIKDVLGKLALVNGSV